MKALKAVVKTNRFSTFNEVDDRLEGNRSSSTPTREALGIANPSDSDRRTVEPRHWDDPFG